MTNPPYGERLLERQEAEALYRAFGKAWPHAARRLAHTGAQQPYGVRALPSASRADKKRKLYNGMLKCDAFFYHGGAKTEPDKG